jgi:hypothetical protein
MAHRRGGPLRPIPLLNNRIVREANAERDGVAPSIESVSRRQP